jgi:hypothetical protein
MSCVALGDDADGQSDEICDGGLCLGGGGGGGGRSRQRLQEKHQHVDADAALTVGPHCEFVILLCR